MTGAEVMRAEIDNSMIWVSDEGEEFYDWYSKNPSIPINSLRELALLTDDEINCLWARWQIEKEET